MSARRNKKKKMFWNGKKIRKKEKRNTYKN